jgi:hypothetical protein
LLPAKIATRGTPGAAARCSRPIHPDNKFRPGNELHDLIERRAIEKHAQQALQPLCADCGLRSNSVPQGNTSSISGPTALPRAAQCVSGHCFPAAQSHVAITPHNVMRHSQTVRGRSKSGAPCGW